MATASYLTRIEPVLRPALAGERLLAASPLVADPGTTEDVSVSDELRSLLDPAVLTGLGAHPGALIQQAAFGRGLVGSPDSVAGRLFQAVAGTLAPTLAVTDAGLAIFNVDLKPRGTGLLQRWFGAADQVATIVHRIPRAAIITAKPAAQGVLRKGRFLIAFADGSGCALVCAPPSLMAHVIAAM